MAMGDAEQKAVSLATNAPTVVSRLGRTLGAGVAPMAVLFALQNTGASAPSRPAAYRAAAHVSPRTETPSTPDRVLRPGIPDWCKQRLESFLGEGAGGADFLRQTQPSSTSGIAADLSQAGGAAAWHLQGKITDREPSPYVAPPPEEPTTALVALVPDPIDSGQQHLFDEQIAAIQTAMGIAGWVRDRQWLPWDDRFLTDPGDRQYSATCRREVPGVLVFRKDGEYARVYLVGETLTSGAPRDAIQEALTLASHGKRDLRIVGPAFSNSASGLRRAIREWRAGSGHDFRGAVHVVAGSANSSGLARDLTADSSLPCLSSDCESACVADKARIDFTMTNVSIDELECALWQYLSDSGVHLKDNKQLDGVGLLSEQGTEYAKTGESSCNGLAPEVALQFPIHVAALRDAYASSEDKTIRDEDIARRTFLEVPLREEPGTDEPVELSPVTLASRDLALSHLLTEVSIEGMRYLGVVATSVADELFLARKIRDVAPDVRLVFFENDALLTHPAVRQFTTGSFVVTAYPFIGSDNFRAYVDSKLDVDAFEHGSGRLHLPLESDLGEAVMNATLVSIDRDPLEYWWPSRTSARPRVGPYIWIGAVGINDVVPISIVAPRKPGAVFPNRRDGEDGWPLDCHPTEPNEPAGAPLDCRPTKPNPPAGADMMKLAIDDDVAPPNIWQIGLALLAVFALHDWFAQWVRLPAIANWARFRHLVTRGGRLTDRAIETTLLRARYALAGSIRTGTLVIALGYMLALDGIALFAYDLPINDARRYLHVAVVVLGGAALIVNLASCALSLFRFYKQMRSIQRAWNLNRSGRSHVSRSRDPVSWVRGLLRSVHLVAGDHLGERLAVHMMIECWRLLAICLLVVGGIVFVYHEVSAASVRDLAASGFASNATLALLRSLPLVCGASPALSFLCMLASIHIWAQTRMNIAWTRHTMALRAIDDGALGTALPVAAIAEFGPLRTSTLARLERHVVDAAEGPSTGRHLVHATCAVFLAILPFLLKPVSTLEGWYASRALCVELGLVSFLIITSILHLMSYWRALRHFLDFLSDHPTGQWLEKADAGVAGGAFSLATLIRLPDRKSTGHSSATLVRLFQPVASHSSEDSADNASYKAMLAALERMQRARRLGQASERTEGALVGQRISRAARASAVIASAPSERSVFVASAMASFIRQYVRQVGAMMSGVVAQSIGLLLAVTGYAMQPKRLLITWTWILMVAVACVALWILFGASRDTSLSRMSRTTPGQVDWNWDLIEHVFRWAAIPILVMIAAEYPGATGSFWEKLAPVFHTLR
jgi:hypothetical protein